MPALPCAGSTYHYQGQESLPSLSLFPSFSPFSLHFPPCSALHAGPWQRCQEPINPLLTQLPRPHPSARLARSIRSFMGNLGPKAAHLEAPSHFLRLFPFCSVFVEDKGRRRLRGEQAAEAEPNPKKQSACFHGNALDRRQQIWGRGSTGPGEDLGGS